MILRADRIAAVLEQGDGSGCDDPLVITPKPSLEELSRRTSWSVDLRLGTWFTSLKQARTSCLRVEKEARSASIAKMHFVPFGAEFVLHPMTFVLAATLEWIRLPENLAAYVVGKSSWGRCGLIIATATGVHPRFYGCLTLELSNVGQVPIAVKPGYPICQLFFHTVEGTDSEGAGDDHGSFAGSRRPLFRPIRLDPIAERLARAGTK